jgi:hypothetical protein
MQKLMIVLLSTFFFQAAAHAEDMPATYSVNVARVQLGLKCTLSKANGGDTDCSIQVKARGKQEIVLTQDAESGNFAGVDAANDDSGQYVLVLAADANKTLQGLSLMHMVQGSDGTSFDMSLSAVQTASLSSVNIPKLNIVVNADESVTIDMTMAAYAPAETVNMVTAASTKSLQDFALKTIQPAIDAARLKLK